jgi:vancomycin resistance protein YoaR
MQATAPTVLSRPLAWTRNLAYFMLPALVTLALLALLSGLTLARYQEEHYGRIFTGVNVWGIDLSGADLTDATARLAGAFPYTTESQIVFTHPATGESWTRTPAELGLHFDAAQTAQAALDVGRTGSPVQRLRGLFESWYHGRSLAPVVIFDEGQLTLALAALAAEIDQTAVDASFRLDSPTAEYVPAALGRRLDVADLRARLLDPLTDFRQAEIELLVHTTYPAVYDDPAAARQMAQILDEPIAFYLPEPLDEQDLQPVELPAEQLAKWLRIDLVADPDGALRHTIVVDENAVRNWLAQFAAQVERPPQRARFYFDDETRELVLVAPHVNGRSLDIDATAAQFMAQISSGSRAVPFILNPVVPQVSAAATAADLGITELIAESVTWFRGSSDARKHNIARAAANFFGIVVAPGEEFSFNNYLGSISEADGYEEGLIIVGGRTIRGIGGGICQVSTTLYQAAFLGGYPITERWPHGYMLGYYNDGQGPGMDATVYSPIVDIKFINNTPYHLLIENYYNPIFEALTFKFYSTSLGRRVEKTEPVFANVRPAPTEDIWEYHSDMEPGTVVQIDWATEGADVSVQRTVYNADGDVILDEIVVSNYIPYPNVFHYGPGVEPYDYSLVPPTP